jgi:polar amino acid transport system substrate-binding protein
MRKLTRTVAVLLMLAFVLGLGACAGTKDEPSTSVSPNDQESSATQSAAPGSTAPESAAPESAAPESSGPALTGTEGKLIMGTNAEFPPYEYYEGEKIVGIDAEIAAKLAEKLGLELQIEDMAFDSIIAAVESGKIDMGMAGMTVDETRLQSVNFTTSYATGVQVIIVPENSEITSVDDLSKGGYTIGVQNATTGDLYATWDLEDEGLATIERYNKGADAVMALTTGKIDCVIIDNEPAKAFVAANEGLKILDTQYAVEDYAIAVNKDNEALLEALDTALQELIDDGTVAAIVDKYIGD